MNTKDKINASTALMNWFIDQDINEADACDVMCVVLASIIRTYGPTAKRRAEGAEVLKKSVLAMMRDMS